MRFFADSYAIIEYLKGNGSYERYFREHEVVTTRLHLMEVYYFCIGSEGKPFADEFYSAFVSRAVEIDDPIIRQAAQFRFDNRKKNLSYADCIGYVISNEQGIRFLTGDKEFRDMAEVEFVR